MHKDLEKLIRKYFGGPESVPDHLKNFINELKSGYDRLSSRQDDLYHLLAGNLGEIVWCMDFSLKFRYVSPSCEKLLGYSPEDLMRMNPDEFATAESVERARDKLIGELEFDKSPGADPQRSAFIDIEYLRRDGSTLWTEVMVTFQRENGIPVGIIGVTRDISERHQAEENLKISETRYRTILDTIHDGYYEVDLSGKYVFTNPAFDSMMGYTREEIIGMTYKQLVPEGSHRHLFEVFHQVFSDGASVPITLDRFIHKDGSVRYGEGSVSLRYNPKGEKIGFCGIIRDVTEKILTEEALRTSEESLRKRNEVIEKDLLTAQLIQRSLISAGKPSVDWLDMEYRYFPLDAVGGDYFSLINLSEGGVGVFVGDVSSHGVSAALFLALVKATSDRVCRRHALQPSAYLKKMNEEMYRNMPLSFLTATYGVFNRLPGGDVTFTFCSAGHPYPVLYESGSGKADYLKSKGTIIGMFENLDFQEHTVTLKKGDRIILYTDGIPESYNDQKEMVGYERLLELVSECSGNTLPLTLDSIINRVNIFKGDAPFHDDVVLMGFEVMI
jgi:phosphoserine phosphatase RsbU/P